MSGFSYNCCLSLTTYIIRFLTIIFTLQKYHTINTIQLLPFPTSLFSVLFFLFLLNLTTQPIPSTLSLLPFVDGVPSKPPPSEAAQRCLSLHPPSSNPFFFLPLLPVSFLCVDSPRPSHRSLFCFQISARTPLMDFPPVWSTKPTFLNGASL